MRLLPTLLVGLSLALAGCFGGDDEGDGDGGTVTTTTTPPATTTTPPANTTTTPPTNGGGNDTGNGGGATFAPREVCTDSFDFAHGDASGAEAKAGATCTVPAGATKLTLNVTWATTGGLPTGVGNTPKVQLVGPDGTVQAESAAPAAGAAGTTDTKDTTTAPAGDWTLQYVGAGTWTATVSVVAS